VRRQGFGERLSEEQWRRLALAGGRRRYDAGGFIMRQGEAGTTVHLLVEGKAKVVLARPDGTEVPLAFRASGELLGEFAAMVGGMRVASVIAMGACETRVFSSARFRKAIAEQRLDRVVWETILARQRESDELRAEQAALPARRRLAAALLRLARTLGEPVQRSVGADATRRAVLLAVALPQRDIADYIGLSRTSIAVEYTRLKEMGVIRTGRAFVAILDLDRLEALAEEWK
jgi:CRP-like cAMP-binding protein